MGKKRFKKGAESLRKIIAIHRNIKLKRAQAEGNIELVLYYEKEIKSLEAELAKKQMTGFGGMISVEMGSKEAAAKMLNRVKVFSLAESLGGVESLISHPASMTHGSVPADVKLAMGLSEGLVRLSCGVEDGDDLQADLEQAFAGL